MTLARRRVRLGTRFAALLTVATASVAGAALALSPAPARAESPTAVEAKLMAPAASPLPVKTLGSADAPVTVVEYASLTCSHCADFHTETFPELKKKYIDTGKVRFIFREFPFDPVATAAFMLARCMPQDKYFPTVSALFETQRSWAFSNDPAAGLAAVMKQAGMSAEEFKACLSDNALAAKIQAGTTYGNKELGINATPTFFINGTQVNGAIGIATWDEKLAPLLAGKDAKAGDTPAGDKPAGK